MLSLAVNSLNNNDLALYNPNRRSKLAKTIDKHGDKFLHKHSALRLSHLREFIAPIQPDIPVVIFDAVIWSKNLDKLAEILGDRRKTFHYWNKIKSPREIMQLKSLGFCVTTFDEDDANTYKIAYVDQFYWYNDQLIAEKRPQKNTSKIAFFCGKDKGRCDDIAHIRKLLEAQNITCDFHIVSKRSEYLPYTEVLKRILQSDLIIDINQPEQRGKSLRPLEALFMERKVISFHLDNDECFNDTLLLPVSKFTNFEKFITTPIKVKKSCREYYSFANWLDRLSNLSSYSNPISSKAETGE